MRLPPLNAVRAFEAAGRLSSFKNAAQELNVTPGAVAKQIKMLEDYFGVMLFTRSHRHVTLTPSGHRFWRDANDALSRLERGSQKVAAEEQKRPLHIWCTALFMEHWLVGRLAEYRALDPDQEVAITIGASNDPMPPEADIGIRFGTKKRLPGFTSHFLLGTELIPICSPTYFAKSPKLAQPRDLARHTLLQSMVQPNAWNDWFKGATGSSLPEARQVRFPNGGAAYRAAIEGVGVAIGHRGFIEPDVAAGRLVIPFDITVKSAGAYHLVYPSGKRPPARVIRFRDWILAQIARGPSGRTGNERPSAAPVPPPSQVRKTQSSTR